MDTIDNNTETMEPMIDTDVDTVKSNIRRHGRSVERDSITFPDGEWTIKEVHALNPEVCHATIYHHVKKMVALNMMEHCGTRKGNRGKPTFLYRKVEPTEVTPEVESNEPF